jgi:hypothetical protein
VSNAALALLLLNRRDLRHAGGRRVRAAGGEDTTFTDIRRSTQPLLPTAANMLLQQLGTDDTGKGRAADSGGLSGPQVNDGVHIDHTFMPFR